MFLSKWTLSWMYETATWQSGKPRKSSPRPIASKHRGLESSLALENNQGIEGINQSPQAINLKLVEGHVMSSSKGYGFSDIHNSSSGPLPAHIRE